VDDKSAKSSADETTPATKIGKYSRRIFKELLMEGKLTPEQISDLEKKEYSIKNFKLSYALLVDIETGTFIDRRYNHEIIMGKYRICGELIEKNREPLNKWLKDKGFWDYLKSKGLVE
jgi:hypothetical protein